VDEAEEEGAAASGSVPPAASNASALAVAATQQQKHQKQQQKSLAKGAEANNDDEDEEEDEGEVESDDEDEEGGDQEEGDVEDNDDDESEDDADDKTAKEEDGNESNSTAESQPKEEKKEKEDPPQDEGQNRLDVIKDKDLSAEEKKIILKLRKRVRGLQRQIKENLEERVSIKKELQMLENDTASREEIDSNVEEVQKESRSSGMANFLGGMWKELRMFQTPFYEERLEERLVALEKQEPNLRDSLDVAKDKLAKHEKKWWARFRPW